MEKIRIGIIGMGVMGTNHANWITGGLVPRARLTAVCDNDPAKLKAAAETYAGVKPFENHLEMMDSGEVDAVIIAPPHYFHPPMAVDALKRGLHTMLEKPVGVYTLAVREMFAEAEKYPGPVFGLMYNERTNPVFRKAKELMDSGVMGKMRRATWVSTDWWRPQNYYDSSSWRASWSGEGGGVLINQAPHQIDLMQWICGMPKNVWADLKYGSHRNINVEDDATVHFQYAGSATGTFIICTHDVLGTNNFEIVCDNGKLIVEDSQKLTVKKLHESENDMNARMSFEQARDIINGARLDDIYKTTVYDEHNSFGPQHHFVLNNFCDAVLDGTPLFVEAAEGIKGLTISNAMHLSSWLGESVGIPFDEKLFHSELQKRMEEERAGKA